VLSAYLAEKKEKELMTQPQGYVDPDYLQVMAKLAQQEKQLTYSWMHLQSGYAVLDVGCGPGTDTIALAGLVGPTGRVVGVDADAAMIAEAERRTELAGCSAWCSHQQADATALPLETGAFDACRSERLFQHLHAPALALAEMARVTRPGGWVVVLDADWGTLSIDTPEVEIERRLVRVHAERLVNNGYAGRQLYRLFKQQGFTDITVESRSWQATNYQLFRYLTLMDTIERDALAAGLITEEELHRWQQSLEQTEAEGTFFAHVNGVLVAGRNRKAANGE
jgi:ubiquinone/menaquinone biosynthesis C-methylase UbiE